MKGRPLGKLIKEHITTRSSSTSAVSEHQTAKHHFDPDKVKIPEREPKDFFQKKLGSHSNQKGEARPQLRQEVGFGSRMGSRSY